MVNGINQQTSFWLYIPLRWGRQDPANACCSGQDFLEVYIRYNNISAETACIIFFALLAIALLSHLVGRRKNPGVATTCACRQRLF